MNRTGDTRRSCEALVGLIAVGLGAAALAAGASAALASRGDPQKQLVAADQARAKAMLVRKTDLGPGFASSRSGPDDDFYCKALDESDLTLTGDARSPDFTRGVAFVASAAQVYETRSDANTSWRQGTSAAGERCARNQFSRSFAKQNGRLVSFARLAFPHLAERSIAYRLVEVSRGIRVYFDIVVLQRSRAQVALALAAAATPVPRADELQVARVVEGRMATAMRGA
jgi:hypothetical protein